jgi:hypothetical protein
MKKTSFMLVFAMLFSVLIGAVSFAAADDAVAGKQAFKVYADYSEALDAEMDMGLSWESEDSTPYYLLSIMEPETRSDDYIGYLGYQSPSYGDDILEGTFKFNAKNSGVFEYQFVGETDIRKDGSFKMNDGTLTINYSSFKDNKLVTLSFVIPKDSASTTPADANKGGLKMKVDGKAVTFNYGTPFIESGSSLMPLRDLLVALNVSNDDDHIIWNQEEKSVTIKQKSVTIKLAVGDINIFKNGAIFKALEVPAEQVKAQDDRVFLPARAVAEALGFKVDYDAVTATVIVTSGK